jgi:HNH endonuclease
MDLSLEVGMTDEAIRQLIDLGWSREQVELGNRANWCCEYCGQNFLGSPDAYASWQVDHIVPVSCKGSGEFDNLAIACRNCNFLFKNKWNPCPIGLHHGAVNRVELIGAVRDYVEKKRTEYEAHLRDVRAVIAADAGNRHKPEQGQTFTTPS